MTSGLFVDVRSALNGTVRRPAGVIVCVEGTAYPGCPGPPSMILEDGTGFWSGFASGLVGGVCDSQDGLFDSYLVPYGAATIPMWPTVQQAREEVVAFLLQYIPAYIAQWGEKPAVILTGYSQGSMATDQVYTEDYLAESGRLNPYLDCLYRSYQFGHVFRTPGIAHGNALIGASESIISSGVETGGIGGPLDLTVAQTNRAAPDGRPTVYSCANSGDIYAACAVGDTPWTKIASEGAIADIFYKVIMQPTFADIVSVAGVLGHPIAGIIELFSVMKFFAEGPNAPHYQYYPQMVGCIDDCYQLGLSLPHFP